MNLEGKDKDNPGISYNDFARVIQVDAITKSIDEITEQLKDTPYSYDLLKQRSQYYLSLEILDKAKQDIEICLSINSDDDEVLYNSYIIAYIEKDYFKAIEIINKAIEINPFNPKYYYGRAFIKIVHFNQQIDGLEDIKTVLELDPEFPMAYYVRGNLFFIKNQFNDAIKEYNKAIESVKSLFLKIPTKDPDKETKLTDYYYYDVILIQLAKAFSEKGDKEQSLKYINEAIEISKDVFNAYIIRVQIFEKFNEIKNALKDLDFLIKENPEKIGLYYFRADLFRLEKNYEFAIADYSVAIKKIESSNEQFPDDILHYFYRGYSYYCIFRYDRAIKDFEKALEIDPEHYASYMNMGLCYRDLKDYNTALEKITKAIDLKPDYDLGLMNRAILFTEYLHQFDKALEDLFKYKEMFGDKQPRVDFYIILCYIEKKEFLKAKPIAEKLLKFITQDPELHYFYAKILQSIGLENDSKKHIEKSITINPDFEKIIKDDPKLSKLLKKRKFFFK